MISRTGVARGIRAALKDRLLGIGTIELIRKASLSLSPLLIDYLAPSRLIRASYGKLPKPTGEHTAEAIGGYRFRIRPAESNVDAAIFYHGIYEAGTVDAIYRLVPRGGSFWDVGAYIGLISVLGAPHAGEIHAFEPHPENRKRLEWTVRENDLAVTVHGFGLSDSAGIEIISPHPAGPGADSLIRTGSEGIPVEVRTVDDVVAEIGPPDVMKLDVEGWEAKVLEGGMTLLASSDAPAVILESSQLVDADRSKEALRVVEAANDYRLFRMRRGKEARSALVPLEKLPRHDNVICLLERHVNRVQVTRWIDG